jgi:hypothetical protein
MRLTEDRPRGGSGMCSFIGICVFQRADTIVQHIYDRHATCVVRTFSQGLDWLCQSLHDGGKAIVGVFRRGRHCKHVGAYCS